VTRRRQVTATRASRRVFVLALVAAAAAFLWAQRGGDPESNGAAPGAPRLPREFQGVVRAGGVPVAGARVRLYEDVPGGYATDGQTGEDGAFRLAWTPTLAVDTGALYVAARDAEGRYALTIAAALPSGTTIDLAEAAQVRGVVADANGRPVAGARVSAAVRHSFEEASAAASDAEGRFVVPLDAPRGAPLDLLVDAPLQAVRVERRFKGGDPLTLHVASGREVSLRLVDPIGQPVAGARVRLAVPAPLAPAAPAAISDADGRATVERASDGSRVTVDVEADGFLPAEAPAWPGLVVEVILWPARDVTVVAWDAWNSRGIEGVRFDVDPHAVTGQDWWGPDAASVGRPVPVRPGATAGSYLARLPRCPVTLHLAAPGYGDGAADVSADAKETRVRLQPPMSRDKPSLLRLRAPKETPPFDVIVADDTGGGFLREVKLREGSADVIVPPRTRLQVGSGSAIDGVFLPKHTTDGLRPGESRLLRLGARPARRLRIAIDPLVDGQASLIRADLERYVAPRRVAVKAGRAEFWVAPFRKYRLEIDPLPGFFPHEADVEMEGEDKDLDLHLAPAARLRYRLVDSEENPVPFARVLVYEPGAAGKMALDARPREAFADAMGDVRFDALRSGEAAVEIGAELFRGQRSIARIAAEGVTDGGTVKLEPQGTLTGTVVNAEGAPVAHVQVRVLSPRIAWLPMPGGGTRELYDLTESSIGDGVTDEKGAYSVPDRAPQPPLIAFYPSIASGLAAMAFEPKDRHELAVASYVELEVPTSPEGVYVLLGEKRAILVKTDPPLSLRPLPLVLPAGRSSLYAKLRDWRWGAKEIDLKPGETTRLELEWQR
jgi:hypothetical protein